MKPELKVCESDASGLKGKASKIVFPENVEQVKKIISSEKKLVVRGAGTGLAGGCIPNNETVVDLSKMNKILSFDETNKIIEVEAGLILDELNDFLNKYNLEFPVKPGSHSVCTIGGMIATDAAGERAVKYGKTGKYVESLEVVTGKAEILEIKKYNITDFIGVEGITGIITKARLKLVEKKKRTASLLKLDTIKEVVDNVVKYSNVKEISEIEFLDKFSASVLELEEKYYLILEFESDQGELKDKEYEELMKKRDGLYPALAGLGFTKIEDPKIQLNRFEDLAGLLESLKIPYYGHLGVGIIHPVFKPEEKDKVKRVQEFVKRIKGKVSGEHGIGISKKEFLDDNSKKLLILIKRRYDPSCKINCGKVVDLDLKMNSAEERRIQELEKIEEAINQENMMNEGVDKT